MTRTWCRRPSVASSTPSRATRAFASRCGEEPDEPERGSRQPRAATLLALLLLVGAGFGLTLRFGVFGTARANQPLLQQVGTDRVRELDLEPNTGAGATTVSTSAVTDAVTTEIAGYRGVERTSARLIRDQVSLDLVLTVTINNRADLDAVRRRIEEHAVSRTRQALGQSQLPGPVARPTRRRLTPTGALTGVQVKVPARTAGHVPPLHHDHRRGRLTFRTDDRGVPAAATC